MNTADIGFEREIWKAADKMRGNIDASEYKSVVLGLIFLRQNLWLLSKIGCNSLLHIGLFATNERHFDVRVTDG